VTPSIDGPAVAYIVADFDDFTDAAPLAWRATQRLSTARRGTNGSSLAALVRQFWGRLRGASAAGVLMLALVAIACGDSLDPADPTTPVASVVVTPSWAEVTAGTTMTLQASPRDASGQPPEGLQVTWTTNNAAIATVSPNGVVTGVGAGIAIISATSGGKTGQAEIMSIRVPVNNVVVTPPRVALRLGLTSQLTAVVRDDSGNELPGRVVTWSTSAPGVATVSATGVVSAVAVGEALVTATSEGRSASAAIQVTPTEIGVVDRVELDAETVALEEGDTKQLTATAKNVDGNIIVGRFVRWTSSNEAVLSVSATGLVTAIRAGEATITARVDAKTAAATARVTTQLAYDLMFDAGSPGIPPEIYTQDIRNSESAPRRVFVPARWAADAMPSPDGQTVALTAINNDGDTDLYLVSLKSGGFVRLTSGEADDDQAVWSPDGRRVAFRRFTRAAGPEVWVIDVQSGAATNLTADQEGGQFTPAWSPDGQRIAYAHAANGVAHLWTMRADGTDKQQVTRGDVWDDQPAWSPNGTTLAFQRTAPAVFGDLYLVNATGGNERKLMPFADLAFGQFAPAWSPDGRLIAFSSKHEGGIYQIYTVWADGSKLARRTSGETNKQSPAWIAREAIGYPMR
jgi:Tol biopolymer transport system component/uncharacterized protein YjdB